MTSTAASILDGAGDSLGGFLPRLGGALLLLVVGLIAAAFIGRLLARALEAAGADTLAQRIGADTVIEKAGLGGSLSRLAGTAVRIGLSLVALFAALSLLGLQFLSESLNQAILFLPNLLVAAGLLLAGVVLGALVCERVERLTDQMDLPVPLGRVAQVAVVAIFAITAAAQIAVSTAILMGLVGVLLAGVVATFALAFGLGGQAVAGELSAGRYLRSAYEPGQTIGVDGVRGEILSIDTTATVLRTSEDQTVHVPNRLLLSSIVTVYADTGEGAQPAGS